jgi:hypothetical protein
MSQFGADRIVDRGCPLVKVINGSEPINLETWIIRLIIPPHPPGKNIAGAGAASRVPFCGNAWRGYLQRGAEGRALRHRPGSRVRERAAAINPQRGMVLGFPQLRLPERRREAGRLGREV